MVGKDMIFFCYFCAMGNNEMIRASRERRMLAATALYVVFAVMYLKGVSIPFMMVFPLATLFLFGIGLLSWKMCLAALFSAAGDAMGVMHQFIPQMGFFMLAHVMMIWWYLPRMRKQPAGYLSAALALVSVLAIFAFTCIITHVEGVVIAAGTSIYCIVISLMLLCSMLQVRRDDLRTVLLPMGAFLFLSSDMVLAWNKFVSDIPGERFFIMVPYYAGQMLIFWGAALTGKQKN